MAVPGIPQNVYLQQANVQAYLSWDITAGASNYTIQRSTDGVNFSFLGTSLINNYLDTTCTVATLYYYQVASVNGSGTSPYSVAQSIIPTLEGTMSLKELRIRSKQRADRENSNFLTLPEWNYNINQSAKELYDLLITAYEDYFVAPRLVLQTTGVNAYALPDGQNNSGAPAFYKLFGVDLGLNNSINAFVTLKKFDFMARNRYVYPQLNQNLLGVFNLEYRLVGSNIQFIPAPSPGQSIGLWYFPRLTTLLQDTDILDGISGWTEYVIVDAAIKALTKEESDTSSLAMQKEALRQRIMSSAVNRDAGQPDTISDVRTSETGYSGSYDFPSGGL